MARMDDGYQTLMTFSADSDVQMWEKEVQPPSVEGGGEVDTTTMQNTTWRTRNPKALKTLGPAKAVVAYDPAIYNEIVAMCNVNQQITITFPDGATLVWWGWIDMFVPNNNVEGEQPTAELTVIPSNQNASGVETAPVFTPAP